MSKIDRIRTTHLLIRVIRDHHDRAQREKLIDRLIRRAEKEIGRPSDQLSGFSISGPELIQWIQSYQGDGPNKAA